MARMPDFEDEIRRDLGQLAHVFTHHHGVHPFGAPFATRDDIPAVASPAPAPQPVTVGTVKEEPVSLTTDLHNLASRLEPLGEEFVTKAEAVAANPATAEALTVLHQLTGLSVPADVISLALGGLKALVQGWGPAPEAAASAQPAPAPGQ